MHKLWLFKHNLVLLAISPGCLNYESVFPSTITYKLLIVIVAQSKDSGAAHCQPTRGSHTSSTSCFSPLPIVLAGFTA